MISIKWKYESKDTAEQVYLHDCECRKIYNEKNNLIMLMEWMEVLESHPDNPYGEAHQSGKGIIELLECNILHCEHNIGDKKILINDIKEIVFDEFEILEYDIEKKQGGLQAKIYMLKTKPQKQYEDLLINLSFKHSIIKFNELNGVSWFVEFNKKNNIK